MSAARISVGLSAVALALGVTVAAQQGAAKPSPFAPLPREVPAPADNPSTPEKVALGKLLFWDPILSGAKDIACATCHHPSFGYSDGRALPIGTGGQGLGPKRTFPGTAPVVKRNSQTILNVAFNGAPDAAGHIDAARAPMFWDSRAGGLEAQALGPIESLEEMRGSTVPEGGGVAAAVARVAAVRQYRDLFARAFGEADAVNARNLSRAIAAFERTLITSDSPFDRYLRGDASAMTDAQIRGMVAFDKQGCTLCHNGPMLSDYQLHVLGTPDNPVLGGRDAGADARFAFRTASLRNLAHTAPYMHGGVIDYLDTAVGFYRRLPGIGSPVGGDKIDPLLRQVNLESGMYDIADFLGALNGTFDRSIPPRVPSGLRPGGR